MRGEWIEIWDVTGGDRGLIRSLPMRGEWIEIAAAAWASALMLSLPMRGEWIEMSSLRLPERVQRVSPHAGRVD